MLAANHRLLWTAALTCALGLAWLACGGRAAATPASLPGFDADDPAEWLNSMPLDRAALRGRPVLIEFWASGCSNCRNTLPWMKRTAERYGPHGLVVVAVHTPEFPSERGRRAVAAAAARLGISYPILLDDDARYWSRMGNRFWPAFYLYDAAGQLVASRIGELHAGERSADAFEDEIRRLLE